MSLTGNSVQTRDSLANLEPYQLKFTAGVHENRYNREDLLQLADRMARDRQRIRPGDESSSNSRCRKEWLSHWVSEASAVFTHREKEYEWLLNRQS